MKKYIILFFFLLSSIFITKQLILENPQLFAKKLLSQANITVNGNKSCDIVVHDDLLYSKVLSSGSLALGETYMDGLWDCISLDQFFYLLSRAEIHKNIPKNIDSFFTYLKANLINLQSSERAFQVGEQHYDLGNDLFKLMLDKHMLYSCAYWKHANTLDQAQEDKCDLICKKLYLQPGMKVLDIGCGWGGFALYAAKNYGVQVVGITISQEQAEYAREQTKGLPVEIRLQDYRELDESFDCIVSVGMFEHVGLKNYKTFMQVANKLLKENGLLLLHTIGSNSSQTYGDPWLNKYIFTNGMLPSIEQIGNASQDLFIMEDWHNFGADYDKTLMAWVANFDNHWPYLKSKYGDRFYRMWKYYLLSCAGLFRARTIQLWQIVFSKSGVFQGYSSIR